MVDVRGKWALVTGASRGIGRLAAVFLAQRGCNIIAQGRTKAHSAGLVEELKAMASVWHDNGSIGASVASGSFRTMGMAVVPCSMKTVAGIVSGYSDNLLLRAADVCMKERRKLVLAARESPLSTVHLRNLCEASQLGAVIVPPMLTYYNHPASLADCTSHTANRILAQFGLDSGSHEWEGMDETV